MFSRRNKKIFTGAVMVIVAIGLIGPGALLFFAPSSPSYSESDFPQAPPLEPGVSASGFEAESPATSSSDIAP